MTNEEKREIERIYKSTLSKLGRKDNLLHRNLVIKEAIYETWVQSKAHNGFEKFNS